MRVLLCFPNRFFAANAVADLLRRFHSEISIVARDFEDSACLIGEQIYVLQTIDDQGLFRVFAIIKPVHLAFLDTQISMHCAPFFVENVTKLAIVKRTRVCRKNRPRNDSRISEEYEVGQSQAKPEPACNFPRRLPRLRHMVYAGGLAACSGKSSIYPIPRTVWSSFVGHLSSILLRRCRI